MSHLSVQQQFFPDLPCFGCGPGNTRGLRLASYAGDDGTVRATFTPWPEHDNGLGYLNGGIIGTILDCHCAAAVAVESRRLGIDWQGVLAYVTAAQEVRYLRPSPLHEAVDLIARVVESDDTQMQVTAELVWQDKTRAVANATWKRWRPRSGQGPTAH